MTDEPLQFINAIADGGPINGGSISFATPALDPSGEPTGVVRGATFTIVIDDTSHAYSLTPTDIGQKWEYRGVTLKAPTDIVDR